ncbi:hypothetical protein O181_054630 [Austropuccinia psidii MF-1]|uniref:Uncharacterized protein n=1 Tax=Austropuccinia psidii MF-1 TaxID=1389203 RepID=A0A9Q3HUJ1_9BASI|nr:hypothetical protein [Austropuccinia psidii MF-1]
MASIDGIEEYDSFNRRMEEKPPSTNKASAKTIPVARSSNSNVKKKPQAQNKGKGKATPPKLSSRSIGFQRFSRMPWRMFFRWPEP